MSEERASDKSNVADKLYIAFHRAWSAQTDGHVGHGYNKKAWQALSLVVDETVKELRARSEKARRWNIQFSENGEEYYGHLIVSANSLERDPSNNKVFIADGVRVEIDEHIVSVEEIK